MQAREIPAKRARARDHLCPDSWIWYPPYSPCRSGFRRRDGGPPLPTLPPSPPKTACRTAVSNSRTCTSTVKPAMFRIGNPPRLQATSKSAVSSKTATETMTPCTCASAKVAAAEGSQFGKPATSNGNYSIYQRLATTQGAKYRWSLKHRARPSGSKSGFDTLAVITADTHGAEPPSFSWGGGTDLFHNMFEWMATVGTAPAGPSPTAASSTSTRATDGTNTKGEFAADGDDTVFALASTTRSTATSHTAISWTTCPLPRKAAATATS